MSLVAQSEHDLLLVTRALVGQTGFDAVAPLLGGVRPLPSRIGPTAARLVRQTLAVGCVDGLLRRGGWQNRSELDGETILRGRLWQRRGAPALAFSALSMKTLRWLLTTPFGKSLAKSPPPPAIELTESPTLADELVLYFAGDLLSPTFLQPFAAQPSVQRSHLCRLAFADALATTPLPAPPPMKGWLAGGGAFFVGALLPDLARHLSAVSARQAHAFLPQPIAATGALVDATLRDFLDGIDALGRRDLAMLELRCAAHILGDPRYAPAPSQIAARLVGDLDPTTPLSARAAARHAVGAPLRALARVAAWNAAHKLIRHFDDGYSAAQHLLTEYEPYAALFPIADGVLHALDAL